MFAHILCVHSISNAPKTFASLPRFVQNFPNMIDEFLQLKPLRECVNGILMNSLSNGTTCKQLSSNLVSLD